jgi:lipoyl(octanoyl) transferase
MILEFCRLGVTEYRAAHDLQVRLVAERQRGERGDIVLVTEHPGVFTLGRRGGREHLVVSEEFLASRGTPVIHVERGGEVTYHGRGQLVVYPIIDLRKARLPLTEYVYLLEELMLRLASDCGITAVRDGRNHGVWVGGRKLGSVGIAVRHGIAFHGLALNVNPDLQPFSWINPCGLREVEMTSLAIETGADISLDRLVLRLPEHLREIFAQTVIETDSDTLLCREEA